MRDREAGETRVVERRVRPGEDSEGEAALFLDLVLTNPPAELGTWPVEDVWQLRDIVRDVVTITVPRFSLEDRPWFLTFEPEDGEELAPEDADEEVHV